MLCNLGQNS